MAGPYRLYSWRNSYSMTAQAALEELGLCYELLWTRIHVPLAQKDPGFLAANPSGRVPTLLTPDGPLYESGAILVYLAERHPEAGLMPPPGDPTRRLFWQWHFYLVSSFQPEELVLDDPGIYLQDHPDCLARLKAEAMDRLRLVWRSLDNALAEGGPYLLGARYSTCDIAFALQALWPSSHPPEGLGAFPAARQCLRRVLARPAIKRVLDSHDVADQARL